MKRILVLGGGASGIVAAISAAEHAAADTEVILLEQNAKLGKKLLATGAARETLAGASYPIAAKEAIAQTSLKLAGGFFPVMK